MTIFLYKCINIKAVNHTVNPIMFLAANFKVLKKKIEEKNYEVTGVVNLYLLTCEIQQ